jgi:hypothetical protein
MRRTVSFSEEVLWRLEQSDPAAPPFTDCPRSLVVTARILSECSVAALQNSITEIVHRHAVLRSRFIEADGGVVRNVTDSKQVLIETLDLGDYASSGSYKSVMTREASRPFDLRHGPLFRTALFRIGAKDQAFMFTVHHLVFDVWSQKVFCSELWQLYSAYSAGRPINMKPLSATYLDYVDWQVQQLDPERLGPWEERLARSNPLTPLHREASQPRGKSLCGVMTFVIPAANLQALLSTAKAHRVTLAMALFGGYATVISRLTEQGEVSIGVPITDRLAPEFLDLIGLFMNILVVKVIPGVRTPAELMNVTRDSFREAFRDRNLPYGYYVTRHPAPFQVIFDFVRVPDSQLRLPGIRTEEVPVVGERLMQSAIALHVVETADVLACALQYRSDVFDSNSISGLIHDWMNVLAEMCAGTSAWHRGDLSIAIDA